MVLHKAKTIEIREKKKEYVSLVDVDDNNENNSKWWSHLKRKQKTFPSGISLTIISFSAETETRAKWNEEKEKPWNDLKVNYGRKRRRKINGSGRR